MKKADVKVGHRYEAKVSGKLVVVKVDHFDLDRGKWSGKNTVTDRPVAGDFRRLRREVGSGTTLMESLAKTVRVSGQSLQDLEDAHADGMHSESPCEGCPLCGPRARS